MAARAGFTSGSVRPRSPDSPSDETASVENRLALCGRVVRHDRSYDPQIYRHKSTGTYLPDRASIVAEDARGGPTSVPRCNSPAPCSSQMYRGRFYFSMSTPDLDRLSYFGPTSGLFVISFE